MVKSKRNKDRNTTYLVGLLWGVNEIIPAKHTALCLVHGKQRIRVMYYALLWHRRYLTTLNPTPLTLYTPVP